MSEHDPDRQHHNVTFAVLALAGISYSLLQSLVAPALPDIQHALHTSENSVSWVLTAYLLSASVATPLIGRLGDMYGKERLLVIVLAPLSAGTLISAVSSSLTLMLIGRVIQGAAGGVFPLAFGIIRDEFPRARIAGGIGLMSALLGVGGGAGVVLAGPIADNLSYHYLFWLPLIPIVIATVLTHFLVPESPIRVPARINWLGAGLMTVGLVAILVAVSETATWHWLTAKTLITIAFGLVVLGLWVRNESRAAEPLVDMRMMRIRGVWTTNLVALLLGFGMYSSFILLPQFIETPTSTGYGFGATVTKAGIFMVPMTIAMLLVGSQTGRLERRFGSKPPLLAGGMLSFASFAMFSLAHSEQWEI
ncbi:MAG: MFS transporter, partial [Gaiellaceae bacterium]